MKLAPAFILIFFAVDGLSQKIEHFYDWNWKPSDAVSSRFYSVIEKKDSVWERKDYFLRERIMQMKGSYKDDSCKIAHGLFYYYHSNKRLERTGNYINGKRIGLWLSYHANGMMEDSAFYENGNKVGTAMGWYPNGYPSDSAVWNKDGSGLYVSWFDNGLPSSAGRYSSGYKMNGIWQFFHKNGKLSSKETYQDGKLINKEYFDEDGAMIADTTNKDRAAFFKGGPKDWQKYLSKQLYFPTQYKIENADKAVVVINAIISEDGTITGIEVSAPLHPTFDNIAVNALRNSPRWQPAISHNRKVKYRIRQPVFFEQDN